MTEAKGYKIHSKRVEYRVHGGGAQDGKVGQVPVVEECLQCQAMWDW